MILSPIPGFFLRSHTCHNGVLFKYLITSCVCNQKLCYESFACKSWLHGKHVSLESRERAESRDIWAAIRLAWWPWALGREQREEQGAESREGRGRENREVGDRRERERERENGTDLSNALICMGVSNLRFGMLESVSARRREREGV